jgi:hypothetical protein
VSIDNMANPAKKTTYPSLQVFYRSPELSNNQLDKIKKFDFWAKIQLYKLLNNNEICEKLNDLRELRNKFAHGSSPPETDLYAVNSITL